MNRFACVALFLGLVVACSVLFPVPATAAKPIPHDLFNGLLKKYVDGNGLVNYRALKASDAATLQRYLDLVSANAPAADWSREEKLAYWINAYNAFTIKQILDKYPTKSIISSQVQLVSPTGPFSKKYFTIGGREMSLNNVEHDIIRKEFNEPRIHFALVCAAVSCPKLRNEAYVPNRLDAQLTEQARNFLNDPTKNAIARDRLSLSKIFDWYKDDFGKTDEALIRYINQYSQTKAGPTAKISYQSYSWDLNAQK
jgi:hypothetical protein